MRSEPAFSEFVAASLPALLRFGHMLTGSRDAGEDLVQTALVSTLAAWSRVERQDDPFAYVRRAMVNSNTSLWRRWGSRVVYDEAPEQVGDDPTQGLASRVTVRGALAALPARQRTVLVLRYYCDLSEMDIADLMGTSPGTVKSQAARALSTLRQEIGAEFADAPGRSEEVARGR